MKLKSSKVLLLSILVSVKVGMADTWTDPATGYTWSYHIDHDGVEIYGGHDVTAVSPNPVGSLMIPSMIGGLPVTSIGRQAFYGCRDLSNVVIPIGVLRIDDGAFVGCIGLSEISIPDSVKTIGDNAFTGCGLTRVEIPSNVTEVGAGAFGACYSLVDVVFKSDKTKVGIDAFDGCIGLSSDGFIIVQNVLYEYMEDSDEVLIPNGVIAIDYRAFAGRQSIARITIPDSVKVIGQSAFEGCENLTNVTMHAGITSIGYAAFQGCTRLASVSIPESVVHVGADAFSECNAALYDLSSRSGVKMVDGWVIGYTDTISSTCELTDVRGVADESFVGCLAITNVTVAGDVKRIGNSVFAGCSSLSSISIGRGITEIGNSAFCACTSLVSILLPETIVYIGQDAFRECDNLCIIEPLDNVAHVGYDAFIGTPFMANHDNGLITIGKVACGMKGTCPETVIIPDGVCSIGEYAFAQNSRIRNVILADSVTNIETCAFTHCFGLSEIIMPNSVQHIDTSAFMRCTNLTSVVLPQCVLSTRISNVFPYFRSITNVVVASGVAEIGDYAFAGCCDLRNVILPQSVTNIGDSAFASCVDLESVTISNSQTIIQADAFRYCVSLRSATLPVSAFQSSYYATPGIPYAVQQALTNIVFCNGTTKIESLAGLADSTALKSVTIPSSVTRIGDYVFKDCAALTDVYFEGDAPDMGADVFVGTPRSLVVHVPEGSIGWSDDFSDSLPNSWNGRRIAYASDSGSGGSGSSGGGSSDEGTTASAQVALTVTNVVVHYVLNSIVPEMAVPVSGDTGFVTVVTEIKGGAVAVAESWATNYPGFTEKFGSDFSAALTKTSGKRDSQGNALMVWQDYVAGTDPTDENDIFKASITLVDGVPQVSYTPELPEAETAKRKYTTYGKARLQDEEWHVVDGDAASYNFFKVTVEMR